jgi:5'-3' exonuclease
MSKVILFKIKKEDIDKAIDAFINKRIAEICKKQKVDVQIQYEVDQAVIEVSAPEYDARLLKIEKYLKNKFKDFNEVM